MNCNCVYRVCTSFECVFNHGCGLILAVPSVECVSHSVLQVRAHNCVSHFVCMPMHFTTVFCVPCSMCAFPVTCTIVYIQYTVVLSFNRVQDQ